MSFFDGESLFDSEQQSVDLFSEQTEMDLIMNQIKELRMQKEMTLAKLGPLRDKREAAHNEARRLRELFEQQIKMINESIAATTQELARGINEANAIDPQILELEAKLKALREQQDQMARLAGIEKLVRKIVNPALIETCRPYQLADIVFTVDAFLNKRGGVLFAHEMSLGKTFMAIVSLEVIVNLFERHNNRKPSILWLTKKSLVKPSTREIKRWTFDLNPIPVLGNTVADRELIVDMFRDMDNTVFVTNYESVRTTPSFKKRTWDLVVIDEVHKLKGGASRTPSQVWVECKEVSQRSEFVMMLSGTPMQNRVSEVWSYLHIFSPERFPKFAQFEKAYTSMKAIAGEYQQVIDVDRLLRNALQGRMIKRTKAEVGLELPTFEKIVLELEMNDDQAELYAQLRDRFFIWLEEQTEENPGKILTASAIIAQLTRLRQLNECPSGIVLNNADGTKTRLEGSSSKIDEIMDRLEEISDQVIIGSNFNEPLYEIQRRCLERGISCRVLAGGVTEDLELPFQQGEFQVLCLNLSMGEGLNLHKNPSQWPGGASTAFFLGHWWNYGRFDQFAARIHRPGAVEPCVIYDIRNVNSVDDFLVDTCDKKAEEIDGVESSKELRPASDWKNYLKDKL